MRSYPVIIGARLRINWIWLCCTAVVTTLACQPEETVVRRFPH